MTIADKTRIIEQALDLSGTALRMQAAEAQALDTFLSYDAPMRARVWRAMRERSRNIIVGTMLIRAYDDWADASVALWVARYNAKWGSVPTAADRAWQGEAPVLSAIEAAQAGALETLATQAGMSLRAADTDADRKMARAELNAANKALSYFLSGLRPQLTPTDEYLISSATRSGITHRVSSTGCTCEAGINGATCWHAVLVSGLLMGYDVLSDMDDYDDEEAAYAEPVDLGRRLAAARALLMVA